MESGIMNETAMINVSDFTSSRPYLDQWNLLATPLQLLTICVSYLVFVLYTGPFFMKNRTPFQLKNLILLYNIIQVVVSIFLLFTGTSVLIPEGLIHRTCVLAGRELEIVSTAIYYYHVAKVTELLDTVFFVLRKKQSQITFLHVYHHAMMVAITWLTIRYDPSYTTIFLGTLNSFVHIVMYSYYGLSTFPALTKYLWWKKYITSLQLVQFAAIMVHAIANYFYSGCGATYMLYFIMFNSLLFIYLFGAFYRESYKSKQTPKFVKTAPTIELNGKSKSVKAA